MVYRFKRLLSPAVALTAGLLIAGTNLGIVYGLNRYKTELQRQYTVPATEWGRFSGDVWGLQWDICLTVLVFYVLAVVLAPESNGSDKRALQRLAHRKLSQEILTEEETLFWSRILEEVNGDVKAR